MFPATLMTPLQGSSVSFALPLQVGLNSFQGKLNIQWHFVLVMTVLTLLRITVAFASLLRHHRHRHDRCRVMRP